MGHGSTPAKDTGAAQKPVFAPMPDPGKKVPIGNGYYLIYGFDKRPKMGMVIMKVEVFTGEGKKDTTLEIKADAGMPSMGGAHETGDKAFKLSNKGDYLLPDQHRYARRLGNKAHCLKRRKSHLQGQVQL